jgi:hypothetical protein
MKSLVSKNSRCRGLVHFFYLVVPYHAWLYKLAYKRAVVKRPHLVAEIIYGADYSELLTGLFPEWDKWSDSENKRKQQEREEALGQPESEPDSDIASPEAKAHHGTSSEDNPS